MSSPDALPPQIIGQPRDGKDNCDLSVASIDIILEDIAAKSPEVPEKIDEDVSNLSWSLRLRAAIIDPRKVPSLLVRRLSVLVILLATLLVYCLFAIRMKDYLNICAHDPEFRQCGHRRDHVRTGAALIASFSSTTAFCVLAAASHPPSSYVRWTVRCVFVCWIGSLFSVLGRPNKYGYGISFEIGQFAERISTLFGIMLLTRRLEMLETSSGRNLSVRLIKWLCVMSCVFFFLGGFGLAMHYQRLLDAGIGVTTFFLELVIAIVFAIAITTGLLSTLMKLREMSQTHRVRWASKVILFELWAGIGVASMLVVVLSFGFLFYLRVALDLANYDVGDDRFVVGSIETAVNAWSLVVLSGVLWLRALTGDQMQESYGLLDGEGRMCDVGAILKAASSPCNAEDTVTDECAI